MLVLYLVSEDWHTLLGKESPLLFVHLVVSPWLDEVLVADTVECWPLLPWVEDPHEEDGVPHEDPVRDDNNDRLCVGILTVQDIQQNIEDTCQDLRDIEYCHGNSQLLELSQFNIECFDIDLRNQLLVPVLNRVLGDTNLP